MCVSVWLYVERRAVATQGDLASVIGTDRWEWVEVPALLEQDACLCGLDVRATLSAGGYAVGDGGGGIGCDIVATRRRTH